MIGGVASVYLVKAHDYFEFIIAGRKIKRGILLRLRRGKKPAPQPDEGRQAENNQD